jgi:hypothetical protein
MLEAERKKLICLLLLILVMMYLTHQPRENFACPCAMRMRGRGYENCPYNKNYYENFFVLSLFYLETGSKLKLYIDNNLLQVRNDMFTSLTSNNNNLKTSNDEYIFISLAKDNKIKLSPNLNNIDGYTPLLFDNSTSNIYFLNKGIKNYLYISSQKVIWMNENRNIPIFNKVKISS